MGSPQVAAEPSCLTTGGGEGGGAGGSGRGSGGNPETVATSSSSSSKGTNGNSPPSAAPATASGERSESGSVTRGGRGFEPEGSPDQSPTAESSSQSVTSSSVPSYERWAEGIEHLLNDEKGADLFKEYMLEENIKQYIHFYIISTVFMVSKNPKKVVVQACKKYIEPVATAKSTSLQLMCLDDDVLRDIAQRKEKWVNTDIEDPEIFDAARRQVVEHMAKKYYLKFFEHEIYTNYIQSLQDPSSCESASASKPHSSASSISGRQMADPATDQLHVSSSPPAGGSLSNRDTSNASSQLLCDLQTVEEGAELSLPPPPANPTAKVGSSTSAAGAVGGGGNKLTKNSLRQTQSERHLSAATMSRLQQRQGDVHPLSAGMRRGGQNAAPAAGPYHANSSTFNPVSRNDSEIQSQSSGAQGDMTDDGNLSAFTDMSGSVLSSNQVIRRERTRDKHRALQTQQVQAKHNKEAERKADRHNHKPSRAGKTNDNPNEAENNPLLFAERLTEKLNTVIAQRAKQANQTQRLTNLDINHPASVPPPRRHPASTSTSYHQHHAHHQTLDQESDQSILDDHCSRVFEESPVTSPRNERADRSAAAAGPQRGMSNTLNPRKMQQQAYGIPHRQQYDGPQYHGASNNHYPGDLASSYGTKSGHSKQPQQNTSKSFSDFQSGSSAAGPPTSAGGGNVFRGRVPEQYHPAQTNQRINNWLQTMGPPAQQSGPTWSSSQQVNPAAYRSVSGMSGSQQYLSSANTLNHSMMKTTSPRSSGRSMNMHNQSMPQQQQQQHMSRSDGFGAARPDNVVLMYQFPDSKDKEALPYMVRVQKRTVTLLDVKEKCPKKGIEFRYYFKMRFEEFLVLHEETDDSAEVPTLDGKVIIECRGPE